MQILLQVVPSVANYQVWWPYKIDISFCKKIIHELLFCDNLFLIFFSFCGNNLRTLRLTLPHVVTVKHVSDMKNRKIQIFKKHF